MTLPESALLERRSSQSWRQPVCNVKRFRPPAAAARAFLDQYLRSEGQRDEYGPVGTGTPREMQFMLRFEF